MGKKKKKKNIGERGGLHRSENKAEPWNSSYTRSVVISLCLPTGGQINVLSLSEPPDKTDFWGVKIYFPSVFPITILLI